MYTLTILALVLTLWVGSRLYQAQALRLKARKNGCQAAPRFKHKDPIFGFDIFVRTAKSITQNKYLSELDERYKTYGHTYEALNFGKLAIHSVHPDNLRAVWSTKASDWGIQPLRLSNMHPLCGTGFITTDGTEWERSRALLKPSFHRSNISDFTTLEQLLGRVIERIPKDGSAFDFQSLMFELYLDMSTSFLLGESIGVLSGDPPKHAEGFIENFQAGFGGAGMRIALGPLKVLLPTGGWKAACQKVHDFANVYVRQALEYRKEHFDEKEGVSGEGKKQRILLYNLTERTGDETYLRDNIIQAFMAAQETTAALISNVFFLLARHPAIWEELRAEVLDVGDRPLDFDQLGKMRYLQNILTETLRLYPVFPQMNRVALRDTILPTGGGPDGTSPVFAPEGTLFDTSWATLHRQTEVWGKDANDFRPSRWVDGPNPGAFEFMPFGGGPRVCLGQQKALMESSYVITRILQTYKGIESKDDRPYEPKVQLTCKSANGCVISLIPN